VTIWDAICVHACFHDWNPVGLILRDDWVIAVRRQHDYTWPGWSALR
jgi:hypothetical protein